MRRCPDCGKEKSNQEFGRNCSTRDGLSVYCRACKRKQSAEYRALYPDRVRADKKRWREANREKIRESKRRYRRDNRSRVEAYKKKYCAEHPERRLAGTQLSHAVQAGKIVRPDCCSACDRPGEVQGHHTDYAKPLEVVWLCPACHSKAHRCATRKDQ